MNLAIQPPGWDSPPEPSRADIRRDVDDHAKQYLDAKEMFKDTCEAIECSDSPEQIEDYFKDMRKALKDMKEAKEYLAHEYSIEEKDIERISDDD